MKIITIIILSLLFPLIMMGQTSSIEKLFKKYQNVDGFELEVSDTNIDIDNDGNSNFMRFLDEIENIYILSFNAEEGDKEKLKAFKSKLNRLIDKGKYTPVTELSGEDEFRILLRKGKDDKVMEVLMLIEEEDESSFILATKSKKFS